MIRWSRFLASRRQDPWAERISAANPASAWGTVDEKARWILDSFFLALELCNFNHARVAKIALETVQRERLSTPRFLRSALRSYHQMTVARFHYRVACETARTSCFPKYLYFLYALSLRPLYICSCSKSDRVAAHVLYHASRTGIEYIGYTSVIQGPHKLRKNSIPTPLTGEASHAASGIES